MVHADTAARARHAGSTKASDSVRQRSAGQSFMEHASDTTDTHNRRILRSR
jgi:hypothetical protein